MQNVEMLKYQICSFALPIFLSLFLSLSLSYNYDIKVTVAKVKLANVTNDKSILTDLILNIQLTSAIPDKLQLAQNPRCQNHVKIINLFYSFQRKISTLLQYMSSKRITFYLYIMQDAIYHLSDFR